MQTGNIGVTTENIFPVIKKFLYSDHEIFIREIVSNAVDATQKLKSIVNSGDYSVDTENLKVEVIVDSKEKTITVKDQGIGMTGEEIEKYINQIAFSGASDFLEKYKDNANAIIGHFGLGFYSSFMVSDTVEIFTKSYKENEPAQHWVCDGSPSYTLEETEKDEVGTTIVMHINEEFLNYTTGETLKELLLKYCRFVTVPLYYYEMKEEEDASTGEKTITKSEGLHINSLEPIWTKHPTELEEKDYVNFYNKLFPGKESLFWIHLNVDFPFTLKGILYFPSVTRTIDMSHDKVYLYCNQVFVTDEISGIVPDFLTLLHGVIDSPDIPLNVSRSYLQSDKNVKQISTYITKKVADTLLNIFKEDRTKFEEKWANMEIFIKYGILSTEDFFKKCKDFLLLKDTNGKYFTIQEYKDAVKELQTGYAEGTKPDEKVEKIIFLYSNNPKAQYTYIDAAKAKGYSVLVMDGDLDSSLAGFIEQNDEDVQFKRIDSDTVENLITKKEEVKDEKDWSDDDKFVLTTLFYSQIPEIDKVTINIEAQSLKDSLPTVMTINEWSRRMKEMAKYQTGMQWVLNMNDQYNIVLNTDTHIIQSIFADCMAVNKGILENFKKKIEEKTETYNQLKLINDSKKGSEITEDEKKELKAAEEAIKTEEDKRNLILKQYASSDPRILELIDLALLQNSMLSGEMLTNFIKRSVKLISGDEDQRNKETQLFNKVSEAKKKEKTKRQKKEKEDSKEDKEPK